MNLTENGTSLYCTSLKDSWVGIDLCLVILHLLDNNIDFALEEVFIMQLMLIFLRNIVTGQTGLAGKWLKGI